jgi:DNA polymerase III epsilon subunit-like protein
MNHIENFLRSVTIIDLETTSLDPAQAEIVEMATSVRDLYEEDREEWTPTSQLFGSKNPIPPEASAVNNISNRMIADYPLWVNSLETVSLMLGTPNYFVAHNSAYERKVLMANFDRANEPDLVDLFQNQNLWICTLRLSRRILEGEGNKSLSLNYLRYYLDLDTDDFQAHSAGHDTMVCALLLERLIGMAVEKGMLDPNQPLGPQLSLLCWAPFEIQSWPFGKHGGKPLAEIPTDYFLWAVDNLTALNPSDVAYDLDLYTATVAELETRLTAD